MEKRTQLDSHIQLSEGRVQSLSDLLNLTLEYFLFFRWIFFKNRPRGNLLFVRSALVTTMYGVLYFTFFGDFKLLLMGVDVDPVIALAAATAVGYWNMANVFYQKSATCANLYNELAKFWAQQDQQAAKLLSNTLSLHLLTMDMWAHRLYGSFFSQNLQEAIEHHFFYSEIHIGTHGQIHSATQNEIAINGYEAMIKEVNSGKLQAKEARCFLDEYRTYLWNSKKVIAEKITTEEAAPKKEVSQKTSRAG